MDVGSEGRMQVDSVGYTGGRRNISLALLVVVNLLPILGVVFLDWDVASLVILYWSENLILGFYTLLKMLIKSPRQGAGMGAFFLLHYGGFCAGHGMIILSMLFDSNFDPDPVNPWPAFLVFPQLLFNVIAHVLTLAPTAWLLAFAAMFISHGASFVTNFLLGPERRQQEMGRLMMAPYGRIMILHVAILVGGVLALKVGEPLVVLLALVILKTAMDYKLHMREHEKMARQSPSPGATQ
ncbi:MAG: DUF6498-containing protein [Halioglobus sp.]